MNPNRRVWQDDEIRALFKSWRNRVYFYRFLKQHHSKSPLYIAISKDLKKDGYNRTQLEVFHKVKNLRRRKMLTSVDGTVNFRWYNEVMEIMKMEKIEHDLRKAAKPQMKQASEQLDELLVAENVPEYTEVVTTNVPNDENDSHSDLLSHNALKHAGPEVPNNIQISSLQLTGGNSKKSTEAILLDIYREFQRSNHELETNDIAILELFKEQNDIFRKQTKLMMKLL